MGVVPIRRPFSTIAAPVGRDSMTRLPVRAAGAAGAGVVARGAGAALVNLTSTDRDGRLRVSRRTTEAVGRAAFAAGVELHELTAEASDLEQVFLELTAEAPTVGAPPPGGPPPASTTGEGA